MKFKIHNSYLYCRSNFGIVNDYYQYIVNLIKHVLENNPKINVNILFGGENENENDHKNNKTIRIQLNYEHTLVKQGGRDSMGVPVGNIKYVDDCDDDTNNYLVRIHKFNELNRADIVIDYSMPNIHNIKMSNKFKEFSKKHIYISSAIYDDLYFIKENRNIITLTTFINIREPRRDKLLKNISRIGGLDIEHINVNNCFGKDALCKLYKNTKILINIHQTDHHHTFEELRVLPALQCGVIVICENSPLSELIPYNDLIIWSSYDDILHKVKDVIQNYDYFHDSIFNNEFAKIKLNGLNGINYNTLEKKIMPIVP